MVSQSTAGTQPYPAWIRQAHLFGPPVSRIYELRSKFRLYLLLTGEQAAGGTNILPAAVTAGDGRGEVQAQGVAERVQFFR